MQIVYRAKNLADAQSARDALERAGIAAHIGDRIVADTVRVQVDNRWLDHARRAIRAWLNGKSLDTH